MHPTDESLAPCASPLNDTGFLLSPSIRLGIVETFVSRHVRLACQLLATDVAYCPRVGWLWELYVPPLCKRQNPQQGSTAALTEPLRVFSCNICKQVLFTKERNVVRNCCPQADRKRVTEHRPKRSKGTRESPSREPTQDQILCGRLTILRQPTHSFVAWTGFKPKREFRRCCVGWLSPKGASPPFTRQPRHTTMHQFEDEDDACRYKEKTSARSGTVGVSRVKVARAAGSIEEQSGWHAGRGATTRLDWATAPNGMGCGYHPPPKSQR
jgi:hypothetical protein